MNNYCISLIVPVYNAVKYLSRCVDSLLNQQFTDFELILINDGSTDASLAVCESFRRRDSRVSVINQDNAGVSSARNHGIEVAKGDYICFVDADDYVSPLYLEQLVRPVLQDEKIDLVLQGRIKCEKNAQAIVSPTHEGVYFLSKDSDFFEEVNLLRFCAVYSKLFKRRIIEDHDISFPKSMNHGEDFDFFARYLQYCDGIYVSTIANYYYLINDGSLSDQYLNFQDEYSCLSHLSCSLGDLCHQFRYAALEKQIKEFCAYFTARVLTSVYEPPRPERAVRLKNLKSINKEFVQLYRDYFLPPTTNSRVFKFLFVNKCYLLFDIASLMWRRKMEKASKN